MASHRSATEHDDSVRGCDWIRYDPKIRRATKQGFSLDPCDCAKRSQYEHDCEAATQSSAQRTPRNLTLNIVNCGTIYAYEHEFRP